MTFKILAAGPIRQYNCKNTCSKGILLHSKEGSILHLVQQDLYHKGGSLGLVVMGGDSCSKGRGFESQHRSLDGHEKTKINEIEAGDGTFKKDSYSCRYYVRL